MANENGEMRAGQITARGRIELVDAGPQRALREGEVVVALETACLCGSDIPYFSEPQERYPLAVGLSLHEIVGTIVKSASSAFREGDRVLAMPIGLRGLYQHLTIADDRLVRVDDGLDNDTAVLAQPMATVLSALSSLPGLIGATVAVVGQGPIGLLFDVCLARLGAGRVIAVDVNGARAARACHFGATDSIAARHADVAGTVRELTGGAMADVVVEAVGHEDQALNACIDLCRDSGTILYFGVPPERLNDVAWHSAFRKRLTIKLSTPADLRPFVQLAWRSIRQDRIDMTRLITHRYRFDEIQRAFETYRDRRDGALKVMIDFHP
jgi:threonine dehydrogenase-like Zn-dependent dehydrogenase